jgi:hypothetical protein
MLPADTGWDAIFYNALGINLNFIHNALAVTFNHGLVVDPRTYVTSRCTEVINITTVV